DGIAVRARERPDRVVALSRHTEGEPSGGNRRTDLARIVTRASGGTSACVRRGTPRNERGGDYLGRYTLVDRNQRRYCSGASAAVTLNVDDSVVRGATAIPVARRIERHSGIACVARTHRRRANRYGRWQHAHTCRRGTRAGGTGQTLLRIRIP